MPLSDAEVDQLAQLLNKMGKHVRETGRVPLSVFRALWENTVMPGVDLAVIRSGSSPEILLALRPEGDPFAGLWHIPGTRVLLGDNAISAIKKRVMERDFGLVLPRQPDFLDARDIAKGPAGPDSSPVGQEVYRSFYYVLDENDLEIPTNQTMKFFPLKGIPTEFLQHQLPTIWKLQGIFES